MRSTALQRAIDSMRAFEASPSRATLAQVQKDTAPVMKQLVGIEEWAGVEASGATDDEPAREAQPGWAERNRDAIRNLQHEIRTDDLEAVRRATRERHRRRERIP